MNKKINAGKKKKIEWKHVKRMRVKRKEIK